MSTLSSNRGTRLLRITSKHHAPERLAWAVALGLAVGLLPKLNLLAWGLYLIILLAPIHTLLSIAVSIAVSLLAPQLDTLTDRIGEFLLTQPVLSWLWATLDNAPIVPWLAFHNTVVLGSLVIALAVTAPTYLLSLRLFEHWEYDCSPANEHNYAATPTERPPLVAPPSLDRKPTPVERWQMASAPQLAALAVDTRDAQVEQPPRPAVPPPKLADPRRGRQVAERERAPATLSNVDQHSNINQWHIGGGLINRQFQAVDVTANSDVARASAASTLSSSTKKAIIDIQQVDSDGVAAGQRWVPAGDIYPESTWRGDVIDSLQVAQNASDVLAWVDEMLDECLSDAGVSIVTGESYGSAEGHWSSGSSTVDSTTAETSPTGAATSGSTDVGSSITRLSIDDAWAESGQSQPDDGQSDQPRWLVETTIEIVRWADETIGQLGQSLGEPAAIANPGQTPGQPMQNTIDRSGIHRSEGLVRDSVLLQGGRGQAVSGSEELRILPIASAIRGAPAAGMRSNSSDFQQPVMAGGSQAMDRTKPLEDVNKGECLGYLLGHLRQAREGKGS